MAVTIIEEAIVAILAGESSITDIIGSDPVRLYPMIIPQDAALPAIVYQQVSGHRDHTMDGPSGYTDSRYQIICWGATYSAAKGLFEAVRKFFDGYHGTSGTVTIQYVQFENEIDRYQRTPGVDVIDAYGKQIDIKITFDEATS